MREAGRITRLTLDALEAHVRAGVTTARLDEVAASVFAEHGARSAPALVYGFPGTVLISINDEVVHGVPGPRRLERGDLVKLDVTVEKDGYVADAARSVVVGPGTKTAHRLVACAASALVAGLKVARAGVRVNEIGRAVNLEVRRHGFSVVRGLTGHGVGRTIHEPPAGSRYLELVCRAGRAAVGVERHEQPCLPDGGHRRSAVLVCGVRGLTATAVTPDRGGLALSESRGRVAPSGDHVSKYRA